ncbi:MAG: UBP-type zinc finger domain-containing protein [Acidimicrobiales bacterium]|nr:UBP-type zinc finger domain-containing protein [Acidimicrobiales bacterium]
MAATDGCSHLDQIDADADARSAGCEDCEREGTRWVHLRRCTTCGHVGCCDSSPRRHATAHHQATGHPLIQSFEPGEDWLWCYVDELAFEIEALADSPSHP